MAGGGNQVAVINKENGGAFFGVSEFGTVDQVFYGGKTNTIFYWSNLTDEILKVVFVGEVLGDDALVIGLDN